ncbi:bifunctional folylpolyglutamate synthase/dihydrofolate synthase [Brachyspira hyodysenteriae]|uniref:Dihydrofolate synthase/folylpolyglutamate synthase n=1 Tax=Brachyspira hyodysenteriae (strain ATCC 49526 / WA1) TaxID=565034 RepID=A0A3B6V801_BRAHW|nr:Mur ligase family protein [Brachyspira hyodysenteriae]ACN82657.1 folylpolyglutamate synthase [Brachyspira hyodysenteriae WA1]AUJ50981.1 bifunctional folylpolyglutamate synthase/dihydrofolate synthase [Brachyspira hyodysenteriae]KLI38111.1 folylpolyglutamate synthase [Brachyspira hyodysenteriae]KLI42071.1 folylpolyglutamate synthase [Brachyspira hyodysenteriae]KLI45882.1 folylpolyglutamate synthase [Brachyspira hyodysenteriae]
MDNMNEALDYIYSFMGKKTLHKNSFNHINNVKGILKILGYKQIFKVIHVTGTKGKGSTTLVLSKMLSSIGYKAGAFISPHIINERERISINEEWISEEDFINITKKIKNIIDNNEIYSNVTVFEIFTIMGLYYFFIKGVDYACIEVGIGGKLDCTNIVESYISILTSISYDHMEILGYTIEEITTQKAGIIKHNSVVISAYQEENSIKIIEDISKENNSKLYVFKIDFDAEIILNSNEKLEFNYLENDKKYNFSTVLLGEHQAENISLSFKALNILLKADNNHTEKNINKAVKSLKDFSINARLTFMHKNPDIIVDGAHNSKSLERILNTIYKWYDDIIILFAPLSQKDIKNMSDVLKRHSSLIILSSPDNISYKETDSYKTYQYFKDNSNVKHIPNFHDAVENLKSINKTNKPVLVIGSLYAASEFISLYKNRDI